MKLYHFSNKDIKDKISVNFFGNNSYSFNDKKYNVNRSFFYTSKNIPEYHLEGSKYCYIVNIDDDKIYNLIDDKENLKQKFTDITNLLLYIKSKYLGVLYNVGFDVVCLFDNINFLNQEVLK